MTWKDLRRYSEEKQLHEQKIVDEKAKCTFSKDETNRLSRPKAKQNALSVRGNLSLAFTSICLISFTSFMDTSSCVGPNHSLMTGPYLSCNLDKRSKGQKQKAINT